MKNRLLLLLLALLGFANCSKKENAPQEVMYGVPPPNNVPYVILKTQGKVTDTAGKPVIGIEVRSTESQTQIVYTSADGTFELNTESQVDLASIQFTDIDGPNNGGEFDRQLIEIRIADATRQEDIPTADELYRGSYLKTGVDATLQTKE